MSVTLGNVLTYLGTFGQILSIVTDASKKIMSLIGAIDKPTFSRDKRNAKRGFEAYFLYSGNKKGLLT